VIKKIKTTQLEPGMFVDQYGYTEQESSPKEIQPDKEIYIDTTKGTETSENSVPSQKIDESLSQLTVPHKLHPPVTTFKDEIMNKFF